VKSALSDKSSAMMQTLAESAKVARRGALEHQLATLQAKASRLTVEIHTLGKRKDDEGTAAEQATATPDRARRRITSSEA
jgi:hypothetical protein